VGLALGGGGVRGFSHVGVLKVLEQEDIRIDLIAGTSAGAIIGGAYASGLNSREIQRRIETYVSSPAFNGSTLKALGMAVNPVKKNRFEKITHFVKSRYYQMRAFFHPAILPAADLQSLVDYFIADIRIEQTHIPFVAVATDLLSGQRVIFREGPMRKAVMASCAVPGAMEPVRHGDWLLTDGGVTSLVPVQAAREAGADMVIAVVVDRSISTAGDLDTAQEIFYRAGEITADKLEAAELREADVVIRPRVGDLHWMDFGRAGDLIREGEIAAREALKEIHRALPISSRVSHLTRRLFSRWKVR
jgi:NTE family protein